MTKQRYSHLNPFTIDGYCWVSRTDGADGWESADWLNSRHDAELYAKRAAQDLGVAIGVERRPQWHNIYVITAFELPDRAKPDGKLLHFPYFPSGL